jgi:O-antigen ligase
MVSAAIRLDAFSVGAMEAFRSIFPMRNKGMNAATSALVPCLTVTRVGVMLMGVFVAMLAVTVVLVLHRRVTSAGVAHAAALCVPFGVSGLRQFLVLVDRTAVKLFRHGEDLARELIPARA